MHFSKKRITQMLKTASFITLGNALLAFLVTAFIEPHSIVMGGITGIALVLSRYLPVKPALMVLLINAFLLVLGLLVIGKKLFLSSIASSLLYPAFLALFEKVPGIGSLTDNRLLAALFAGVLMGAALGLVMRVGSSTGGTDITNLILAKLTHRPVAVFVYLSDIVIVGAQAPVSDAETILLGIVVLVLESLVLNYVMVFGSAQIQLYVVSAQHRQIKERLLKEVQAGVTLSHIQTGWCEQEQKAVMCIIPPRKLYAATEAIRKADPEAFITITKIKEVRGKGFTLSR